MSHSWMSKFTPSPKLPLRLPCCCCCCLNKSGFDDRFTKSITGFIAPSVSTLTPDTDSVIKCFGSSFCSSLYSSLYLARMTSVGIASSLSSSSSSSPSFSLLPPPTEEVSRSHSALFCGTTFTSSGRAFEGATSTLKSLRLTFASTVTPSLISSSSSSLLSSSFLLLGELFAESFDAMRSTEDREGGIGGL